METANTQKAPAAMERKTQCYIATLLNRETNRLAEEVNRVIEDRTRADEIMNAIEDYRRARDERDAFRRWMNEQGAAE